MRTLRVTAGPVADLGSGCGELQADQGGPGSPPDPGREVGTVGGEEGLRWRRREERQERQEGGEEQKTKKKKNMVMVAFIFITDIEKWSELKETCFKTKINLYKLQSKVSNNRLFM